MKRIKIILLLVFITVLVGFGQETTFTLEINSAEDVDDVRLFWGEDKINGDDVQDINYGDVGAIRSEAWTYQGVNGNDRGLIRFNFNQLPANAKIIKAELSLYHFPIYDEYLPMSDLDGSNETYLRRVTADWDEHEVTWNTQPMTTTQDQLILSRSQLRNQDYPNMDVTKMVEEMLNNNENYGFMLQLVTEEHYRCMMFASSDHEDINIHPKLVIEYQIREDKQAPFSNVRKISATQGGFTGILNENDLFSQGNVIGDVDGDGIEDMAIGAILDDDGVSDAGAVWILFMNENRSVKSHQKISSVQGNFTGKLFEDRFGRDIESIGDFDQDGTPDIAVGAYYDSDGGIHSGAVWILLLNSDGTVKSHQKISSLQGGLEGLGANRFFGTSISNLGDLDEDGIIDIAVGVPNYDDDGGLYGGCIWILFLNADGTVKAQHKINDYQGGFDGILKEGDKLGVCVENIGDINKDGIPDIAVHAQGDDDGGSNSGALYVLFLNRDGSVQNTQKISASSGGFSGIVNAGDNFGRSISAIGDVDGDGIVDLLTTSTNSDDGGVDRGKAWILLLNIDATVKNYFEINSFSTDLSGQLDDSDYFGESISCFSNYSSEGKKELIIGTLRDDDGAIDAGAVYIMDLDVKHKPVAVAGEDQQLCFGEQITIDGIQSSVLDNDTLYYSWSCENYELTDSTLEQFEFIAPVVDIQTTFEFSLSVQCEGVISDADTIVVTVYPLPEVAAISQDMVTLSTIEADSYQWYLNGELIEGVVDQIYTVTKNGAYQVQIFNEIGCSTMSEIVNVLVVPIAKANAVTKVCSGTVLTLNGFDSSSPLGGNLSYQWSSNDLIVPDAQMVETSFIAPKLEVPTVYNFYLVVGQNEIESLVDTISVTINPAPVRPYIEQFADTLLTGIATDYQWYLNENEIDGAIDQVYVVEQSGSYYVKVVNEYGCVSDPSQDLFVAKTSIEGLSYEIRIYPNPVSNWFTISGLPTNHSVEVQLFNLMGQFVGKATAVNGEARLDLSGLQKGTYLLSFENNFKESIKILKE